MSQRQPQSPQQSGLDQPRSQMQQGWSREEQEPIKYGDVFNVTGDLAKEPIAPEDANMMQSAETRVFGQTQKGGAAASMQAAATVNERSGLVGHREATDAASERGVTVMEADVPGARIVTERVAGQVTFLFYHLSLFLKIFGILYLYLC
uniref:Late embryogenesis abundant protein 4 n=1 Tax=Jatropha curcas TaxID=180498 RepID=A0A0A7CBY7_JATCU|nr:late embryogenesis abundant protein 4 [Jatropha curcas]